MAKKLPPLEAEVVDARHRPVIIIAMDPPGPPRQEMSTTEAVLTGIGIAAFTGLCAYGLSRSGTPVTVQEVVKKKKAS